MSSTCLRFDWTVNNSNWLVEDDLIKLAHHGSRTKGSQVSATARTWTGRVLGSRFGKLDRTVTNLHFQIFELVLCFGPTLDQNVRGAGFLGESLQKAAHVIEQAHFEST